MFVATLTATIGLAMLPNAHAVTAEAAEPATYHVKYSADNEGWVYQFNTSVFDDEVESYDVYYLLTYQLKDGDVVIVYNDSGSNTPLNLGNVHLSNLTVNTDCKWSMVTVGSVDNFYANAGSNCSITGNITNAHVFLNALANFNNDVQNLTQYYYYDNNGGIKGPTIGCGGKVTHFTSRPHEGDGAVYHLYEVTSLSIIEGIVQYGTGYSYEPIAAPANSSATSSTPSPTPAAGSSSSNSSDEYDDVPRTGQNNVYLWLLGAAAACFVGSGLLRKTSH